MQSFIIFWISGLSNFSAYYVPGDVYTYRDVDQRNIKMNFNERSGDTEGKNNWQGSYFVINFLISDIDMMICDEH